MNSDLAPEDISVATKGSKAERFRTFRLMATGRCILIWPLIVAGGRLVFRTVMNLWNLIEPGGSGDFY